MNAPAPTSALHAALVAAVGFDQVLTDPDLTAGHLTDWTGRFRAGTGTVVRPGSTAEVAAVLQICAAAGAAVVAQGGNTGLVGGSIPHHGEIVVSLRRLSDIQPADPLTGQLTAGAGATIAAVRAAAAEVGLGYGIDLASRDSATVGGTIATNAGGLRVLRYGDTRRQVVGLEAVLSDGTVISHLGGLTRDNSGYHLPSLLAGSEGTLAVITRARLRLVPATGPVAVALLGLTDLGAAVRAAGALRREPSISAVELIVADGLALVRQATGLPAPLGADYPAYLLVECTDRTPVDTLASAVAELDQVQDAAIADDPEGRARLWSYRERHTESIATVGTAVKMDVTLPLSAAPDFLAEVPGLVAGLAAGAQVWLFGHIADGNVHVNVTGSGQAGALIEDAVFSRVAALGGSISSEHGIGWAKRKWLPLGRSAAEIATFRRIRSALDPAGILNPAVLF